MQKRSRLRRALLVAAIVVGLVALPLVALAWVGWPASSSAPSPAELGVARSQRELEALIDTPGPLRVQTIVAARWQIDRSGLIDLEHPRARAAGLVDGPEPIEIVLHAVRHPSRGLFLIDSGVERAMRRDRQNALLHGFVADAMGADAMRVEADTASWIASQDEPVAGVLLTHLHLDHVLGLPDVDAPIYLGPGETTHREALHVLTSSIIDRALAGHALREWRFEHHEGDAIEGVLDVFGDRSLFALWMPGHTPGTTAYLARTRQGPVLFTGDVSHTAWGWENDVPPGTFSSDRDASAESFALLRALVARHPGVDVRLGHQELAAR